MSLGIYDNQKFTDIKHWSTEAVRDPWGRIQKTTVTEMWVFAPGSRPSYYIFSLLINYDSVICFNLKPSQNLTIFFLKRWEEQVYKSVE